MEKINSIKLTDTNTSKEYVFDFMENIEYLTNPDNVSFSTNDPTKTDMFEYASVSGVKVDNIFDGDSSTVLHMSKTETVNITTRFTTRLTKVDLSSYFKNMDGWGIGSMIIKNRDDDTIIVEKAVGQSNAVQLFTIDLSDNKILSKNYSVTFTYTAQASTVRHFDMVFENIGMLASRSETSTSAQIATDEEYLEGTSTTRTPNVKQVVDDLYISGSEGESFDELWEQPILTANGTLYVDEMAVKASTEHSASYAAWRVFDKSTAKNNAWLSAVGDTEPRYLTVGFLTPKKITEFTIQNRDNDADINARGSFKTFTLQGSKTNVVGEEEWVDIQSYTNDNNDNGVFWTRDVDLANQDYYYGYRFKIDESNFLNGNYTGVGDISFVLYNELHKISVKSLTEQNTDAIKVLQAGSLDTDLNKLTTAGVDRLASLFSIEEMYYDTPVVFTESDSYIVSTSGKYVLLCGAGGSGGCGTGGGGAGGGTSSAIVDLAEGDVLTVTVGAGGRGYAVSGPVTAATGGNSSVKKGSTTLSTTVAATACNGDTGGKGRAGTNGFAGGNGGTTTSSNHDIGVGGNGGGHGLPGFGFEYLSEVLTAPTGEPGTKLDTSNEPGLPTIAGGGGGGGNSLTSTSNAGAGGRGSVVIIPVKYRAMTAINYCCVVNGATTGAANEVQDDKLGNASGIIGTDSRHVVTNPFGAKAPVICLLEILQQGKWVSPGWYTAQSQAYGAVATYSQDVGIVVQTGRNGLATNPNLSGSPSEAVETLTEAKARVHVWKLVGINPDQAGSGSAELPIASDTVLGGIKVGTDLAIDTDGVLSIPVITDIDNALELVDGITYEYPALTSNDSSNKLRIISDNEEIWKLFDKDESTKISFYSNLVFDVVLEKPCVLQSYTFISRHVSGSNFSSTGMTVVDKHSGETIDDFSMAGSNEQAVNKTLAENTILSDHYTITIKWSGVGSHPTRADTLDLNFGIDYVGSKTIYDINERIANVDPEYDTIPETTLTFEEKYITPVLTTNGTPYTDEYALTTTGTWMPAYPLVNATNENASILAVTDSGTTYPIDIVMTLKDPVRATSINFANRSDTAANVHSIKNYIVSARVKDGEWVELVSGLNTNNTYNSTWSISMSNNQEYYNEYKLTIVSIYPELNNSLVIGHMQLDCVTKNTLVTTSFKELTMTKLNSSSTGGNSTNVYVETDTETGENILVFKL